MMDFSVLGTAYEVPQWTFVWQRAGCEVSEFTSFLGIAGCIVSESSLCGTSRNVWSS